MSDKLITLAKILCVIVGISFSLFMKIFRFKAFPFFFAVT